MNPIRLRKTTVGHTSFEHVLIIQPLNNNCKSKGV